MNSNHQKSETAWQMLRIALFWLITTNALVAAADDLDLAGANGTVVQPLHTYNFSASQNPAEAIAVLNASGDVFWDFSLGGIPPGTTATTANSFTHSGITVTLPAVPPASVASSATVSITGTPPLVTGSFSFTLEVSDAPDSIKTRRRTFEVIITQPMDVVLVFDRSGSMGTTISPGVTRWDALRQAASNFGNIYQALDRNQDRFSITYFETDLIPASACCNGLIPFASNLGTTIQTDLNANTPDGLTAIGTGLKNAEGKLIDATRARSILLFTDGEQNQNPAVNLNGQGYNDGTSIASGIKIATIGIDTPSGTYNTTLANLAIENDGSYNTTDDGNSFNFQGGDARGDLSSGFQDAFFTMLEELSPQLVARASTNVSTGTAPHSLLSFPLNNRVEILLLEFAFDRSFEIGTIFGILGKIMIEKDGASVMAHVRPSFVGDFTNTMLLKIDFQPTSGAVVTPPPIESGGNWTVKLGDVSNLRINECRVSAIAEDKRLNYKTSHGTGVQRANSPLALSVDLDWLSRPIEDATIVVEVYRPGESLGHALAKNSLIVDVSDAQDAGSPGTQKFDQLWANDKTFRDALARSQNAVPLKHTRNGHYEGVFNGLTVTGNYRLIYRISGNHPDAGVFQRMKVESFYTSPDGIDLGASDVTTDISSGQLVIRMRPVTKKPKNEFLGPGAGSAFSVSPSTIQISNIIDHQDGRYTLTFTGNIKQRATLSVLGQKIYSGKLGDIGGRTK